MGNTADVDHDAQRADKAARNKRKKQNQKAKKMAAKQKEVEERELLEGAGTEQEIRDGKGIEKGKSSLGGKLGFLGE